MPEQFNPEQLPNGLEEELTPSAPNEEPLSRDENKDLGAKLLSQSSFDVRNQEIVNSSFAKARKAGEKLPGKNNERRNYAYLSRLERLIEKHGKEAEKRLWRMSINDNLVTKFENIPEAYWDTKRQEYRDNGHGYITLEDEDSRRTIYNEEILKHQKESLEAWANYLGDEKSPYPLWFKIYAWDGMTKMGKWSKDKGEYERRNETTAAPYPEPNAEALNKVFEVVNQYHGNGEKEFRTKDGERNINLEKLVQSGNFAKIYNAIEREIAPIIEPPERAEDVHGEWVEYRPGQEEEIAAAGRGTRWCIGGSPATVRSYLTYGNYGEYYDDEQNELKSRFFLLHLEDPKTGKLARNAVASIRLGLDGCVEEISGLLEGQALNDSLVKVVEEKVKSLHGGEEYLPKFADKNRLIALDRKMEQGEDLAKEELEFLYEIHRPIETLDTYNNRDPRIEELREKYGIYYALDHGVDANQIASKLSYDTIIEELDTLVSHGADINQIVSRLPDNTIVEALYTLVSYNADIDNILTSIYPGNSKIFAKQELLKKLGVSGKKLLSAFDPNLALSYLSELVAYGVSIDDIKEDAMPYAQPDTIMDYYEELTQNYGIEINLDNIIQQLLAMDSYGEQEIIRHRDLLIKNNIDINEVISRFSPEGRQKYAWAHSPSFEEMFREAGLIT